MIRLHHCPQTRSMRALWLLHELDVEFDVVVHPFDKSLRAPEYLALNPAGRVPALEIDGKAMFETGAIAQYLCEQFAPETLGRMPGHPERADWLVWLHYAETISQHIAALTQQHVALYDDAMRSPIVMRLEAARLGKCLTAVNEQLSGREYLLQSGFSAADIGVGQAIYMGRYFHSLADFPALNAWYERLSRRDGFRKSIPQAGEATLYRQDFYPAWTD